MAAAVPGHGWRRPTRTPLPPEGCPACVPVPPAAPGGRNPARTDGQSLEVRTTFAVRTSGLAELVGGCTNTLPKLSAWPYGAVQEGRAYGGERWRPSAHWTKNRTTGGMDPTRSVHGWTTTTSPGCRGLPLV